MKTTKTYSNFIASSVLLVFVACLFIEVAPQENYNKSTLDCIDFEKNDAEIKAVTSIYTVAKTNSSPALLKYGCKHQANNFPFEITINTTSFEFSSKVGLFILYSSLKLAPSAIAV